MFSVDPYIADFVSKNFLGLLLFREALKRLAKITPWAIDDHVYQIFTGLLGVVKNRKSPEMEDKPK